MPRQEFVWFDQRNFDGGINENQERFQPNQLLEAENLWCPNGALETRPNMRLLGSPGIASAYYSGWTISEGTEFATGYCFFEDVSTGLFYNTDHLDNFNYTTLLNAGTLAEGDRIYFGYDPTTTDPLSMTELPTNKTLFIDFMGAGAITVNSPTDVNVRWEYYSSNGWIPLDVFHPQYGNIVQYFANFSSNDGFASCGPGNATDTNKCNWTELTLTNSDGSFSFTGYFIRCIPYYVKSSATQVTTTTFDFGTNIGSSGETSLKFWYINDEIIAFDISRLVLLGLYRIILNDDYFYFFSMAGPYSSLVNGKHFSNSLSTNLNFFTTYRVNNFYGAETLVRGHTDINSPLRYNIFNQKISLVNIVNFNIVYIAYDNITYYFHIGPSRDDNITYPAYVNNYVIGGCTATVEDREEYVGSINGIKSDYHPDYVAQLSSWPKVDHIAYYQQQLFVTKDYTIRWSAPSPAHNVWPEESFEYITDSDNSKITGMHVFDEHLYVFTNDSIYRIVYNGVGGVAGLNTYTPVKIPGGVGCSNAETLQEIVGNLIFLYEDGIYVFDGVSKPVKISENIESSLKEAQTSRFLNSVFSCHWKVKNCYIISFVSGDNSKSKTFVYDYKNKSWWIWTDMCGAFLSSEDENDNEILLMADCYGNLYQIMDCEHHGGTGYNDNTFYWKLKTHRISYDDNQIYNIRNVNLYCEPNNNKAIKLSISSNDETIENAEIVNIDMFDSTIPGISSTTLINDTTPLKVVNRKRVIRKIECNKHGNWFHVQLENNGTSYRHDNKKFKLNKLSIGTTKWGTR